MNIPKQLQHLRVRAGKSISEISLATGIPKPEIHFIEQGITSPKVDDVERIAEALGVPAIFIICGSLDISDIHPDKRDAFEVLHPKFMDIINNTII